MIVELENLSKKYGENLRKGMIPESFVLPKPDSENIN